MKKITLVSISVIFASVLWISTASDNEAYAISGCCKQRNNTGDSWYRVGSDLPSCKNLNAADKDNIFHESGLVWWDVAC